MLLALAMLTAAPDTDRALIEAINARLLAGPTATSVLQAWCDEHKVGEKVRAEVDHGVEKNPSASTYLRLQPEKWQKIAYRRVRLSCGPYLLSEADNWYVPERLSPAMNEALTGDAPFGAVIKPLNPSRKNIAAEFEWEGQGPQEILRHRADVIAADGRPLSEVVETYQRTMLKPAL